MNGDRGLCPSANGKKQSPGVVFSSRLHVDLPCISQNNRVFTAQYFQASCRVPIIRDLSLLPSSARGGAVAIGNFDGVHRGHLEIVKRLLERSREVGGPAIVF